MDARRRLGWRPRDTASSCRWSPPWLTGPRWRPSSSTAPFASPLRGACSASSASPSPSWSASEDGRPEPAPAAPLDPPGNADVVVATTPPRSARAPLRRRQLHGDLRRSRTTYTRLRRLHRQSRPHPGDAGPLSRHWRRGRRDHRGGAAGQGGRPLPVDRLRRRLGRAGRSLLRLAPDLGWRRLRGGRPRLPLRPRFRPGQPGRLPQPARRRERGGRRAPGPQRRRGPRAGRAHRPRTWAPPGTLSGA